MLKDTIVVCMGNDGKNGQKCVVFFFFVFSIY